MKQNCKAETFMSLFSRVMWASLSFWSWASIGLDSSSTVLVSATQVLKDDIDPTPPWTRLSSSHLALEVLNLESSWTVARCPFDHSIRGLPGLFLPPDPTSFLHRLRA